MAQTAAPDHWTGPYIGGHFGYAFLDEDIAENGMGSPVFTMDNGIGGVLAGYNLRVRDRYVIGAEADFSWANLDGLHGGHMWGSNWSGTIRGRLGYLPAPETMVYLTAGAGYSELDYVGCILPAAPAPVMIQEFVSELLWAYALGLGFETGFNDMLRMRFEYLFSDYEDWHFSTSDGDSFEVDPQSHIIRFGVVIPLG